MADTTNKKITADIVLSMGGNCRTAKQLKNNKLRRCAFPLDWMLDYELEHVLHHFKTDFVDFFKRKEITNTKKSKNYTKFWVKDLDTGMMALHHFTADVDLNKQYKEAFMPVMLRRYNFVKKIMQKAKHIVFVSARQDDIAVFKHFLEEMHKLYPCKMTFINIRHNDKSELYDESQVNDYMDVNESVINDDLKIIDYSFDDRRPDKLASWVGNTPKWAVCLENYQLSLSTRLKSLFKRRNIKWLR